jgi:hypothetical protein
VSAMTYPHPTDAEDTKAGFANDDYPFHADCDCCDRKNVPLRRCWAYGIETFACEECA